MHIPVYRFSISQAAGHTTLRDQGHSILSAHDINSNQWRILGILGEHPEGLRIADLAYEMFVQSPLVNMLVKTLVEVGYVKKIPHPYDQRANLLIITPAGKQLLDNVEREMQREIDILFQGISESDTKTYLEVLDTIKRNGQQRPQKGKNEY